MSLDGAQIAGIAASVGSLITGIGVATVNGLFSRRGETHKATMETIAMLREGLRESKAAEQKALKRIGELEKTVHVHHDVIRVAHYELSVLMLHDGLPGDVLHALEKVRDKLDTRIK